MLTWDSDNTNIKHISRYLKLFYCIKPQSYIFSTLNLCKLSQPMTFTMIHNKREKDQATAAKTPTNGATVTVTGSLC